MWGWGFLFSKMTRTELKKLELMAHSSHAPPPHHPCHRTRSTPKQSILAPSHPCRPTGLHAPPQSNLYPLPATLVARHAPPLSKLFSFQYPSKDLYKVVVGFYFRQPEYGALSAIYALQAELGLHTKLVVHSVNSALMKKLLSLQTTDIRSSHDCI